MRRPSGKLSHGVTRVAGSGPQKGKQKGKLVLAAPGHVAGTHWLEGHFGGF